jgi:hypothetical protein
VAIARFRLLVAALQASKLTTLRHAPGFRLNVAVGDSLLHGRRFEELDLKGETRHPGRAEGLRHVYGVEDLEDLNRILGQQYHVVVGNPPYITVKDQGLNQAYRKRFTTCHRQYSLAVPFTERFFDLAVYSHNPQPAGYVGMITANSFMKREFGKKLIEEFFPRIDLTHVIDTSGAYIPGHGTPTVILFGRHRAPVSPEVRAVLGIQGEPGTPEKPAQGKVWRSIVEHLDNGGAQNEFVSVANMPRETFARHPWSIGGGGAASLKDAIDLRASQCLQDIAKSIGFYQDTHADQAFVQSLDFVRRHQLQEGFRYQVRGEQLRDWSYEIDEAILFPYHPDLTQWIEIPKQPKWSWFHGLRTLLWTRSTFGGGTYRSDGRPWFDYHQFPKRLFEKFRLLRADATSGAS